jgi:hypothetical protein
MGKQEVWNTKYEARCECHELGLVICKGNPHVEGWIMQHGSRWNLFHSCKTWPPFLF